MTLKGIKRASSQKLERPHIKGTLLPVNLTDQDVRRILWDELDIQGRFKSG